MTSSSIRIDILTLHPEMCRGPLELSILGRAQDAGLIDVQVHDLRAWAEGKHRQVDDTPYGGGSGMVMRVDVVDRGIQAVTDSGAHVILMDPAGKPFEQADAHRLSQHSHLVMVCGHYEGIDARIRDHVVDEVLSVGDYVLTGGELPALVVTDAVCRLLPGVLGNPESSVTESFADGFLEAPQYTRPRSYRGWDVPEVLLSGHHARIDEWRNATARALTETERPDLIAKLEESD